MAITSKNRKISRNIQLVVSSEISYGSSSVKTIANKGNTILFASHEYIISSTLALDDHKRKVKNEFRVILSGRAHNAVYRNTYRVEKNPQKNDNVRLRDVHLRLHSRVIYRLRTRSPSRRPCCPEWEIRLTDQIIQSSPPCQVDNSTGSRIN